MPGGLGVGCGDLTAGDDKERAHQRMPQCNLARVIQLEAGYPPSVGKIVGSASLRS